MQDFIFVFVFVLFLQNKSVNRKPSLARTIFSTQPKLIFPSVTKLQRCLQVDLGAYNLLSGNKIFCSLAAIIRQVIF